MIITQLALSTGKKLEKQGQPVKQLDPLLFEIYRQRQYFHIQHQDKVFEVEQVQTHYMIVDGVICKLVLSAKQYSNLMA